MKKIQLLSLALLLLPFAMSAQRLVSMSPTSAIAGQTLDVIITGEETQFNSSTTVSFDLYQTNGPMLNVVNSVTALSATSLKANITIPATAESGDFGITVSVSPNATTNLSPFHIDGVPPPPYLGVDGPEYITANKTMDLTILGVRRHYGTGTHFKDPNGTTVMFDPAITVHSITIVDDSTIVAHVTTPNASGQNLTVTNSIDGQMKTQFKVYPGTGISTNQITNSLRVYPSPASNSITLTSDQLSATTSGVLSIYGVEGKLVLQQVLTDRKTELDISSFNEGLYIMQLAVNNKTGSIKFIKE